MLETKKLIKHKTEQQEEPAVFDTINKIEFKKNNDMKLTFVCDYHNDAMFAGRIKNSVIIFNNDVV